MLPVIIALLILGIFLLIVELIIPGFGIPGILGITFLFIAALISTGADGALFIVILTVIVVAAFFAFFFFFRKKKFIRKLVLEETSKSPRKEIETLYHYMGMQGTTQGTLRPYGKVDFDGKIMDAFSDGEYIPKGVKVKVVAISGKNLIVREIS